MNITNLVIAGNYLEFKNFIYENNLNLKEFRYIAKEEDLYGYRNVNLLKIGTWWRNPVSKTEKVWRLENENNKSVKK